MSLPSAANSVRDDPCTYYGWLFILMHTVLWTLGPAWARLSIPHDTLEGITWGYQWQLGYAKHPFLAAWLCAGISDLFKTVGWPVYLLAQLAVSTTFFAVWQLGKLFLPPKHALISFLLLEGIFFYNINSFNFTPDTLQSPLWALLIYFFYQAIVNQTLYSWLITGVIAALCVCAKYQFIVLAIPLFLFILVNPKARQSFAHKGIYLSLGLFLLLLLPHFIWLYSHDLITLHYAQNIPSQHTSHNTIWKHLIYPIHYLINTCVATLGLFILLWPFYSASKIALAQDSFKWQFLMYMGFGPFICTLVLCIITGDYFTPRWSTPYFSQWGIIALVYLKPALDAKKLWRFTITLIIFSLSLFMLRMGTFTLFPRVESDAFLPNQTIAQNLSQLWQEQFHYPLPYLAGSNYLVSSVLPYMPDKPKPYFNWDIKQSPWINEQQLRNKGGLFIWDEGRNYIWDENSFAHTKLPSALFLAFPRLQLIELAPTFMGEDSYRNNVLSPLCNHLFNFVLCSLSPRTFLSVARLETEFSMHSAIHRSSDNHPIIIGVAILRPQDHCPIIFHKPGYN